MFVIPNNYILSLRTDFSWTMNQILYFVPKKKKKSRSHWPRGLRCRSTAARLLRSWVRILAHMLWFRTRERATLSAQDYMDYLRTARWKAERQPGRWEHLGNYLTILYRRSGAPPEKIKLGWGQMSPSAFLLLILLLWERTIKVRRGKV
jgi:hypothetical protein